MSKQPNLVVHNHTVTVPEGETVKGDVTVKNGKLIIKGKIDGDVTVVNGEKYMASAGQVTGQIEEINQLFDWTWYKMKSAGKKCTQCIQSERRRVKRVSRFALLRAERAGTFHLLNRNVV